MKRWIPTTIAFIIGCLLASGLTYFVTRPDPTWILATSGSRATGVSVRGIFGSKDACLIFHKIYLERRKTLAEDKDTKVEFNESAGIVATSKGRWDTASCLTLSDLPSPPHDLTSVEDALRDVAMSVNQ